MLSGAVKQAQSDEGFEGKRSVDAIVTVSPNVPTGKPARILTSSFLPLFLGKLQAGSAGKEVENVVDV